MMVISWLSYYWALMNSITEYKPLKRIFLFITSHFIGIQEYRWWSQHAQHVGLTEQSDLQCSSATNRFFFPVCDLVADGWIEIISTLRIYRLWTHIPTVELLSLASPMAVSIQHIHKQGVKNLRIPVLYFMTYSLCLLYKRSAHSPLCLPRWLLFCEFCASLNSLTCTPPFPHPSILPSSRPFWTQPVPG